MSRYNWYVVKKATVGVMVVLAIVVILAIRGRTPEEGFSALEDPLAQGTEFILYSLEIPIERYTGADVLHGFKILGNVPINDEATRKRIVDAIRSASQEPNLAAASCFNPRHAITLNYHAQKYEILVCFECQQAKAYVDGVEQEHFLIGHSARDTLNTILTDANVPLDPGSLQE